LLIEQLLNLDELKKYDSQQMYKIYDKWSEIARESFESNQNLVDFQEIEHIVFAGMGGSGTVGDIFGAIFSKTDIHVNIIKGYTLPRTVNENTLVITTSVSGNTVETLNILNEAHNKKCKSISFSNGGKIQEFCMKHNLEHKNVLKHHSARASLTSFLYFMLNSLESITPINKKDIEESIKNLKILRESIGSDNLDSTNPALELANWISGIPLIYYPFGLQAAAIRFKNSLQENAKIHVITEDIVESCHNGIVAWKNKSNVKPILIQGNDDYIKTKERWVAAKEFFDLNKIDFLEIKSIEGNILSKILNLIYLFDYSSIYKAVNSKIDPTPIEPIDFIKSRST